MVMEILVRVVMVLGCLTIELTHAGPESVAREAGLRRPSGVVCSDLVRRHKGQRPLLRAAVRF